jgi:DNA-binding transcriptional regulator LsrR (DeoR family)
LKAVGLVRDDLTCELPITQKEFADALGFSVVHVNRTLQELRTAGLISLTGNRLHVREWAKLVMVGDFDATFLHIKGQEAVVSGSE